MRKIFTFMFALCMTVIANALTPDASQENRAVYTTTMKLSDLVEKAEDLGVDASALVAFYHTDVASAMESGDSVLNVYVQEEVDVPTIVYDYTLGYSGGQGKYDTSMVIDAIGCTAANAEVFGFNLSTKNVVRYAMETYDGWLAANGDLQSWGEAAFNIKFFDDGTFWYCTMPNVAKPGATYKASWLLVNPNTGYAVRYNFVMKDSNVEELPKSDLSEYIDSLICHIEAGYADYGGFDAIIAQLAASVKELIAMVDSVEDPSLIMDKANELSELSDKAIEIKDEYDQFCEIVKEAKELYAVTGAAVLGDLLTDAEVLINSKATLTTESLDDIDAVIKAISVVIYDSFATKKVWDFNLSSETIEGLTYDCYNYGGWYIYNNGEGYVNNSYSSYDWREFSYYRDGTRIIPETEGIYFFNRYGWVIYSDGTNRIKSYGSGSDYAFMIPNQTKGQIIKINYSTGSNGNTRGITRYSDNTMLVSGQDRTTGTTEVSYEVISDGNASFYPYNGSIYINSISLTVPGDPLRLAELRMEVADYMATLSDFPGLKNELQSVYDNAVISEESDVENIIGNLKNTLANVKKAIEIYPIILVDIDSAKTVLEEEAYVDLSEALALGTAIDVNTSTSAEYMTAFDALETTLAIYNSDKVEMSDWAFNTNTVYTIDGLSYYLDTTNHLAEFINFNHSNAYSGALNIPANIRYNGTTYVVVAMINNGRYTQDNITSVTLPKTLRYIGDYGLGYMSNVRSIEIPENVTSMGSYVFSSSSNLTSIKMNAVVPPAISSMSGSSYKKITIPVESFHAYRIANVWKDNILIGGDGVTVSTGKIVAGDLAHIVLDEAGYLQEVNKLIIDEGTLNNDDWNTIKQMTNLVEVDLSGVTMASIPSRAFDGRWAIEKVALPHNTTTISSYAFQGTGLKEMVLPETVKTVDSYAFCGSSSLSNVIFNEGLEYINVRAFQSTALENVVLPNSLLSIGDYAFENYNNTPTIKTVQFGENLQTLGGGVFQNQSKLGDFTLPESVNNIGDYAFNGCAIRNITLPGNLKTLNKGIFAYNTSLVSIVLPEKVQTINSYAFEGCTSLAEINLNEGLINIYSYAFQNCTALNEVVLPSSLERCEGAPFYGCSNLKKIEARSVIPPTTGGSCPLSNVSLNDVVLTVPSWSTTEYPLASGWSSFYTVEASDFMPQYIKVNKDFYFTLRDTLAADYRPDIKMAFSDVQSTDAYGYTNYERGNLTVSGRSKLAVNNLELEYSAYAKYYADRNVNSGYSYDNYRTSINSTSLIVNGEMRAEDVTIWLNTYNSRWQFISFPFDVKVGDITPGLENVSWVIRGHNGKQRAEGNMDVVWENLTAEDTLYAGKGYIMHTYNPTNGNSWFAVSPIKNSLNRQLIFSSEDRTIELEENLAEFDHNRSWNLIGNPYPCFYDSRFMDFDAPFIVWNSYSQNYVAYNSADDAYILSPGEAFFVQRPFEQESITFRKEGRQTHRYAREMNLEAPARAKAASNNTRTIFNLTLQQDTLIDRTRVVFNDGATLSYEMSRDAAKFASTERNVPQIFTIADKTRYAINERPFATGDVALGVYCGVDGEFTISLDKTYGCKVILEDKLENKFVELTADNSYTFIAFAGENLSRFVLHFENEATGVDNINVDDINADDAIYNLQGIKVNSTNNKGIYIKNGQKTIIK